MTTAHGSGRPFATPRARHRNHGAASEAPTAAFLVWDLVSAVVCAFSWSGLVVGVYVVVVVVEVASSSVCMLLSLLWKWARVRVCVCACVRAEDDRRVKKGVCC